MSDIGAYKVEIFSTEFPKEELYIDVEINVKKSEPNLGLIIGCSVGGCVLLVIIVAVVYKCRKKHPQQKEANKTAESPNVPDTDTPNTAVTPGQPSYLNRYTNMTPIKPPENREGL